MVHWEEDTPVAEGGVEEGLSGQAHVASLPHGQGQPPKDLHIGPGRAGSFWHKSFGQTAMGLGPLFFFWDGALSLANQAATRACWLQESSQAIYISV